MSSTNNLVQPPPLPKCLPPDEGERARQRLAEKNWISRLRSSFRQRRVPEKEHQDAHTFVNDEPMAEDIQPIILVSPATDAAEDTQDRFAWAVLYENQRGMTIFSIPYYSHRSLLPMDPEPFTLPSASLRCSPQPFTSLDDYQLPDGTWRWVSKVWMIDMRSDTGEVQYDGFEYNWLFRKHHWRAKIGPCGAGAWVRRRRWLRLMMRPGKQRCHEDEWEANDPTTLDTPAGHPQFDRPSPEDLNADNIWLGQNPEEDWNRCHALMKWLDHDGHKLELWYAWLEPPLIKGKNREATSNTEEDTSPTQIILKVTSPPKKECIVPVLQHRLHDILHLFVFPDSRAKWLGLVARTGVLPAMSDEHGLDWVRKEVDFWSYSEELLSQTKSH